MLKSWKGWSPGALSPSWWEVWGREGCDLLQVIVAAGPGVDPSFWTLRLEFSTEMIACCLGNKHAKPPSSRHFCGMCWLGGWPPFWMSSLPLFFFFRGLKGWTHSKFIVGILFSFPEWPGILELLHFIGSKVARERHTGAMTSFLSYKIWL